MSRLLRQCSGVSSLRKFHQYAPILMNYHVWELEHINISAAPILILHDVLASSYLWHDVAKSMVSCGYRRVLTLDIRNHGLSPHTHKFGSEYIVSDCVHLMSALSIPRCCLLGHRMGGLSAIMFAMAYPELVDRLILVDASPIAMPKSFGISDQLYNFVTALDLPAEVSLAEARTYVRMKLVKTCCNKYTATYIAYNLRKASSGKFYWGCNFRAIRNNWSEFMHLESSLAGLHPFLGPTLLIAGSRTDYVHRRHVPLMMNYLPNMRVEWMQAFYSVQFERPKEFMESVCDFCS